ncbi:hypothetical protein [Gymnodinialimonas ceratoperidinii]|uniref:Uncharacterized protein n=1 Tax=Gymnodinialimonas ceratoperidinii TaxID=2856823 RepID=A0A8F6Y9Q7_9RHOB|nr:hypothetical protein [Gymnodinialimonas ceratoperidinii]QXT38136.1 hypothetical protein KYE46_09210 [Gymnodinialimonas ceratoperidinii]
MQVVYHLGAPCTDADQLLVSLLKNRLRLAQAGISVPPPGRYRSVIRDTARALKGRPAGEDVQDALLDAIVDDAEVDRLILSDPRFVCINRLVVQGAQIWPMVDRSATGLRALFPEAEIEFFIGMRDPATLIPALFKASRFTEFEEFTENMQPHAVTWSETMRRLQMAHPDCRITTWCNEDTPLLWGEILRAMAGVGPTAKLVGVDDLAATIMEEEGYRRMRGWLDQNPPETETQRRRVLAAFLERYAKEEEIEETLNLPGWTEDLMDTLSQSYDEDMEVISRIPGVTLLTP